MTEITLMQPAIGGIQEYQCLASDATSLVSTTASIHNVACANTQTRLPQKIFTIQSPTTPETEAVLSTKEVHCQSSGLQPYLISRRGIRRPMITISSLPGGDVVAGTKAGRRKRHVFVGCPEQGATVWLPVVKSRETGNGTEGTWTFGANDRLLQWKEHRAASLRRTEDEHHLQSLELVDASTAESLAEYSADSSESASLRFYADMEQSLELLTMASVLAIVEQAHLRAGAGQDADRRDLLGSDESSPASSRSNSPRPGSGAGE